MQQQGVLGYGTYAQDTPSCKQASTKIRYKIDQKSTKKLTKIEPKSALEGYHGGPWPPMGPTMGAHEPPRPILAPFLAQLGAILGGQLAHVGAMLTTEIDF